ncbi:hypothetical protein [Bdellovibrio sp. NC01]|uniref:hypothetical protein n=1 Tax=Bdellovibrio sp. NC01 TaxID=2220073 RepID=UPI00115C2C45|nr:hypothetical protein [Bdellovibrio sp. NC01]
MKLLASLMLLFDACQNAKLGVARAVGLCYLPSVSLRVSFLRALILPILLLIEISRASAVNRISAINKDLSQVKKIYLHAGLVSTVEFTAPVWGVKVGNNNSIKAEISPSNPKEITLRLKYQNAEPTNMIVRIEKRVYVFDLIPSRNSHQDYVLIRGSYGSPAMATQPTGLAESNTRRSETNAKLIESVKLGGE